MGEYRVGVVIRGKYFEENLIEIGGRGEDIEFLTPDPKSFIKELPIGNPAKMADLYGINFEEILDYLSELGKTLKLETNSYMQESFEATCLTSALTKPIIKSAYDSISHLFNPDYVREIAEKSIGIDCLDGWRSSRLRDGRTIAIRAFGARTVHVIAGNSPVISAMTVMRNAITRGDAIIKTPSNDPFTAVAIGRTMIDMAPDHPLTKHVSAGYWKGGDEEIEQQLYQPHNIEKLVAWGGFASVKHVTKYIQPGLELVALDPKRSISIIGSEALKDDETRKEVAKRLATDIGSANQEGCVSARVVYVLSGTNEKGVASLNQFGEDVYNAMLNLPESLSTKPKNFDQQLRSELKAARLSPEWYHVIGGLDDEGAIVVSQIPEVVEFAPRLANRVANLVPVDSIEEILSEINAYTQTVGIYPESLKTQLVNTLPVHGVQRLTSLGYAGSPALAGPQDAIEPLRRICKWIMNEGCDPDIVTPRWETGMVFKTDKVVSS